MGFQPPGGVSLDARSEPHSRRGGKAILEHSTSLTILGVVFGFTFVIQALKQGRRRAWPQVVGLALVIAALGGYLVYRHRQKVREAQELVARRAEFQSGIAQFAAKYNAVTDWQKALEGKPGKLYSAELLPLLARPDGRPVLVFAALKNISENNGQAEVYFDYAGSLESQFKLELDCTPAQARSLMSDNSAYGFEVIAQIQSVAFVQAGDYSLAEGRCIDVMPVSLSDYLELVVGPELQKHARQGG